MCYPWDFNGNGKNLISISVEFCVDIFIRNENMISEKYKKNPFEIILHVEKVTNSQAFYITQISSIELLRNTTLCASQ